MSILLSRAMRTATTSIKFIALYPSTYPLTGKLLTRFSSSTRYRAAKNFSSRKTVESVSKSPNEYKNTVLLPKSDFPLRANAVNREQIFRERCTSELYPWQFKNNPKEFFVLHDGPPYANGPLHIGHAVNKILKDILNRFKVLQGFKVHYVPGWDCHGLPIEQKALAELNIPRSELSPMQIRNFARSTALFQLDKQREDFKSWGIMGDWEHPYKTLDKEFEVRQLNIFYEMVKKGHIFRQKKPVYWSPSSKTALAESELEYKNDHLSRSIYVKFPVLKLAQESVMPNGISSRKVNFLIWTTTPWTIPANKAIAVNPEATYCLVKATSEECWYIVAKHQVEALRQEIENSLGSIEVVEFSGKSLIGSSYTHPLSGESFEIIGSPYVTIESGTGLVHTAPGHGMEDYEVCRPLGIEPWSPVDGEGKFTAEAGSELEGLFTFTDGNRAIIEALVRNRSLLKEVQYKHKYPYDWRTKKPVMLRATAQWFVNIEELHLPALAALKEVNMFPESSLRRLEQFILSRKEWCISRQRSWGVPIPVLYDIETEEPLLTETSIKHIVNIIAEKGSDAWWEIEEDNIFVANEYRQNGRKYRRGMDTMDVWFDSGSSWNFLAGTFERDASKPIADVYLEGSDQHRGWFQSSLLTSIAVTGKAPYSALITHGFVIDEQGRKMSKSIGNVVEPRLITHGGKDLTQDPAYGTDILRLWVAMSDYTQDISIGKAVMGQISEVMRKFRTTARFMLGNLSDFKETDIVDYPALNQIDKYMLYELYNFGKSVKAAYDEFAFFKVMGAFQIFTNNVLSAFYFDIVKDRLYNDHANGISRRSVQSILFTILSIYMIGIAPIACHTAEEIYDHYKILTVQPQESVFRIGWPVLKEEWNSVEIKEDFNLLMALRNEVNGVLEVARQDKVIRSPQEANLEIYVDERSPINSILRKFSEASLSSLYTTSQVSIIPLEKFSHKTHYERMVMLRSDISCRIVVMKAIMNRCPRCWNYVAEKEGSLCRRCENVIGEVLALRN